MVDAVGSSGGSGGKAAKAQHICKVCDKTFSRIQSLKVKWYLYHTIYKEYWKWKFSVCFNSMSF